MRFLRRIGQFVTMERVLWFLAVSVAAVVFFEVGRAYPRIEPFVPDFSAVSDIAENPVQEEFSERISPTETESTAPGESQPSFAESTAAATSATTRVVTTATTAVRSAGETGGMLNLNTVTKEQLKTINGIGDAFAERIIAYRDSHGGFQSVEELKEVSGIGEKRYAQWSPYFTVS